MTSEAERTAMKDPEHLKRWLRATGRNYIFFRSEDLVDSLSWPRGVEALIGIIDAYRAHRREIPTETMPCPNLKRHELLKTASGATSVCTLCNNKDEVVTRTKGELLEADEIDAAIAMLNELRSSM